MKNVHGRTGVHTPRQVRQQRKAVARSLTRSLLAGECAKASKTQAEDARMRQVLEHRCKRFESTLIHVRSLASGIRSNSAKRIVEMCDEAIG